MGKQKEEEKNYYEDRISELPDHILVYIFSLMTMKEAAITSVLSRRWEKLWTFIPSLEFDASAKLHSVPFADRKNLTLMERPGYVSWVNHVLESYQGSTIDEFIVRFDLDSSFEYDIDRWVYLVLKKKVKRLELDFSDYLGLDHVFYQYTFPLYCDTTNRLLTRTLALLSCNSLTNLQLKSIDVSGEILEYFICNCPLLEWLTVMGSHTLVDLIVAGPSLCLKYLEITSCFEVRSIRISAPDLVTFIYGGSGISVPFEKVPSLVEVSLYMDDLDHICNICQFSSCFSQIKKLTLHADDVKKSMQFLEFPTFYHLQQLELIVSRSYDAISLLGFSSFIKASPSLYRFALKLTWTDFDIQRELQRAPKCLLPCLKVVEFVGFVGRINDTELLIYLLENAIMLEKLILDPRDPCMAKEPQKYPECKAIQDARERALWLKSMLSCLGDKVVVL